MTDLAAPSPWDEAAHAAFAIWWQDKGRKTPCLNDRKAAASRGFAAGIEHAMAQVTTRCAAHEEKGREDGYKAGIGECSASSDAYTWGQQAPKDRSYLEALPPVAGADALAAAKEEARRGVIEKAAKKVGNLLVTKTSIPVELIVSIESEISALALPPAAGDAS